MSKLIRRRFDSIPKIAKRVPFYFMLAALSIGVLAVIQYLTLEHMPIWNATEANRPRHRLTDFNTTADGRLIASYIDYSGGNDLPSRLLVSLTKAVDSTKNTALIRPSCLRSSVSPCGNWLCTVDIEGNVSLFTTDAVEKESKLLRELGKGVTDLFWSNDSQRLLVCTETSVLLVNRLEKIVKTLPLEPSSRVFAPPGADCFLVRCNNKYCLFDWATGQEVREVPIDINATSFAFSADLRFTAYVVGSTVRLFDLWEEKLLWSREYRVPWTTKNSLAFARDDRSLCVVSTIGLDFDDYIVNMIDVKSQREICTRRFENEVIAGVHFSMDDSMWLWSTDGSIRKWDWHLEGQGHEDELLVRRRLLMPEFE